MAGGAAQSSPPEAARRTAGDTSRRFTSLRGYHFPRILLTHSYVKPSSMKKVVLALIFIIITAIAALGIAAWKIGSIVATYKPQIEQSLSTALGAEVALGNISVSLVPSTTLSVESVMVRSAGGASSDLSVASVEARAALLPLLSKRVEISSVEIHSPRVTLIRDSNGVSVRGLGPGPSKQSRLDAAPTERKTTGAGDTFKVDIHSIEIHDGALRFEDRVSNTTRTAENIQLRTSVERQDKNILLSEGVLSLTVLAKHTLELTFNRVSLDQAKNALTLNAATLKTPAGDLAIAGSLSTSQGPGSLQISSRTLTIPGLMSLAAAVQPSLKHQTIAGSLSTNFEIELQGPSIQKLGGTIGLKNGAYSSPGTPKLTDINGTLSIGGSLSDITIATSRLALNVESSPAQVSLSSRITPNEITIGSCKVLGLGGEISLPSSLNLGQQTLRTAPALRALSLPQVLALTAPNLARSIQGTLSSFDGQFGEISFANPAQTVSGSGNLVIKDGVLKGFNLAHQVMSNIDGLPFISGNLRKRVPPEFEKYFSSPDTTMRELNAKFAVAKGVVQLNELRATSDIFSLLSQGSIGVDGQLDLKATIAFAPDLSNAITNRVLEMKPMLNKDGRLAIPLIVKGKAPAIVVLPDLTDIAQRAAVGTIRETLGGALKGGSGAAKGIGKGLGKVLGF